MTTHCSDTVLKCPVVFLMALDRSKTVPHWSACPGRRAIPLHEVASEPRVSEMNPVCRSVGTISECSTFAGGPSSSRFFRLVFTFGLVSFSLETLTDGSGGNGICTKLGCETMIWMFVKDMRPLRLYALLISDSIVKVILNSLLPNKIKLEGGVEMMSTESLIKLKCEAGNRDS